MREQTENQVVEEILAWISAYKVDMKEDEKYDPVMNNFINLMKTGLLDGRDKNSEYANGDFKSRSITRNATRLMRTRQLTL